MIIPVYNTQKYISKCINSVIFQSYENLDIILVDDGSTDGCSKICDEFAQKDSRIQVIHKKNGGLVSARKAGIPYIKGDYVISVDSDDWMNSNYLENFVRILEKTGARQVWSVSYCREYENHEYRCEAYLEPNMQLESEEGQKYLYRRARGEYGYKDDIPYYMWSKCVEKKLFAEVYASLNDKICYHEDLSFSIRCIAKDAEIVFIDNSGYHYFQRPTSVSHVASEEDIEALQIVHDETIEYLSQYKDILILKQVPESAYISAMMVKNFRGLQVISDNESCLKPFHGIKKGSSVIVFGMGNVGKQIVEYISDTQVCELVAATDTRMIELSQFKYTFILPENILQYNFDYVIIATVKNTLIGEIREKLIRLSVPENKIVYARELF